MLAGSAALSFVHPFGVVGGGDARRQILAGTDAPASIRELVRSKCGNCHSEAVDWPIYSRIAPASWLLEHDVVQAREHMNLSRWDGYGDETKEALLTKLAAEVRAGEMPPRRYTAVHPGSRLTQAEQDGLIEWTKTERKRLRAFLSKKRAF